MCNAIVYCAPDGKSTIISHVVN